MDKLWAPWRVNYINNKIKPHGCIFCRAKKNNSSDYVIFKTKKSICLLNIYPYNNGHLLISPLRHVADIDRMEEDHRKAKKLAQGLAGIKNVIIHPEEVETNILFFDVSPAERTAHEVAAALLEKGVRVHPTAKTRIRCVAHLDVSSDDIDRALEVIAGVMKR